MLAQDDSLPATTHASPEVSTIMQQYEDVFADQMVLPPPRSYDH
jgi:hypothetical protein